MLAAPLRDLCHMLQAQKREWTTEASWVHYEGSDVIWDLDDGLWQGLGANGDLLVALRLEFHDEAAMSQLSETL